MSMVIDEVPAGKSVLCVLDKTGDTKTIWDPSVADEVDAARAQYDKFKAKGYIAYKVDDKGEKSTVMGAFDPMAGKVIMARALTGG
jgi:predicted acetyltransferase